MLIVSMSRDRVDAPLHVRNVAVLEAADDMHDRVDFADVREELVAQPFALARARDQAGDIDELDRRGTTRCGLTMLGELVQPLVRHLDDADVRLDRAKRIVGRLRARPP